MVRIINFLERVNNDGETFYVLVLQGGIQMIKSQQTNKFYVTAKRTTITSTFDESTCKSLVGTELPGNIEKVKTEPYEFTIKETGEIIELDFRYEYQEESQIYDKEPERSKIDRTRSTVESIMEVSNNHEFSLNGVG